MFVPSLATYRVYRLYDVRTFTLSHFPGIVCPNLTNPENGQVVQLLDGNVPGTVENFSCYAGYNILGNVTWECISAGLEAVWIGEDPTCQRKMLKKNVL